MTAALPLLEYGERRRDIGMARAECAQERDNPGSVEFAYSQLVSVAKKQMTVHSNDLRHVKLERFNAWGSIWQRARRNGIIERTDRVRPCIDPKKAAHLSPVYRSLVYRGRG